MHGRQRQFAHVVLQLAHHSCRRREEWLAFRKVERFVGPDSRNFLISLLPKENAFVVTIATREGNHVDRLDGLCVLLSILFPLQTTNIKEEQALV